MHIRQHLSDTARTATVYMCVADTANQTALPSPRSNTTRQRQSKCAAQSQVKYNPTMHGSAVPQRGGTRLMQFLWNHANKSLPMELACPRDTKRMTTCRNTFNKHTQPASTAECPHTSHVSNGGFWHAFALLLMLFSLAAKQAGVWQNNHSCSGLVTSPFELANPC